MSLIINVKLSDLLHNYLEKSEIPSLEDFINKNKKQICNYERNEIKKYFFNAIFNNKKFISMFKNDPEIIDRQKKWDDVVKKITNSDEYNKIIESQKSFQKYLDSIGFKETKKYFDELISTTKITDVKKFNNGFMNYLQYNIAPQILISQNLKDSQIFITDSQPHLTPDLIKPIQKDLQNITLNNCDNANININCDNDNSINKHKVNIIKNNDEKETSVFKIIMDSLKSIYEWFFK